MPRDGDYLPCARLLSHEEASPPYAKWRRARARAENASSVLLRDSTRAPRHSEERGGEKIDMMLVYAVCLLSPAPLRREDVIVETLLILRTTGRYSGATARYAVERDTPRARSLPPPRTPGDASIYASDAARVCAIRALVTRRDAAIMRIVFTRHAALPSLLLMRACALRAQRALRARDVTRMRESVPCLTSFFFLSIFSPATPCLITPLAFSPPLIIITPASRRCCLMMLLFSMPRSPQTDDIIIRHITLLLRRRRRRRFSLLAPLPAATFDATPADAATAPLPLFFFFFSMCLRDASAAPFYFRLLRHTFSADAFRCHAMPFHKRPPSSFRCRRFFRCWRCYFIFYALLISPFS